MPQGTVSLGHTLMAGRDDARQPMNVNQWHSPYRTGLQHNEWMVATLEN